MAFKFKCEHCGEELIVYYLKKGEEAKCTACAKQTIIPEFAEYLGLSKQVPVPCSGLPIKQDEDRRRERTREEIIHSPSVRVVKWVLDIVWYIGIIFVALTLIGEVVLGPDSNFYGVPTLELPVRVYYNEPQDLIPNWEGGNCDSYLDDIVLLGHNFSVYEMPGESLPLPVMFDMILSIVYVMAAVYFLRKIFRSIIGGKPFLKQNSKDLRKVGYLIATWGPAYGTFNFFQGAYYLKCLGLANANVSVELHLYPKIIIIGIVIIAIAHLFELAARIQHEQDLTI